MRKKMAKSLAVKAEGFWVMAILCAGTASLAADEVEHKYTENNGVQIHYATRAKYIEAFERSSLNGMMNYYRQNYPRKPYQEIVVEMPNVALPVLQFHGLKDTALHHHGLNNTWEWLDKDYTLVTIPHVGHWAHHEAADLVTDTMKWWLKMRR